MLPKGISFLLLLCTLGPAVADSAQVVMMHSAIEPDVPTVQLDNATVTGFRSVLGLNKFLGIPFAKPPVKQLRFRPPEKSWPYNDNFAAMEYGDSCPQHVEESSPPLCFAGANGIDIFDNVVYGAASEDCLTLNVITPPDATPGSDLPVVVWIFGGGFVAGGSNIYDTMGQLVVTKSMELGVPAIYVSINYRVNAFGFLPGEEVKEAGVGNLGLRDQRLALHWVNRYINAFGGNPKKVTLWGESAGAISAALQMVTNGGNTEGLFQAAFMQSGAPIPVGDMTNGQRYFDALAKEVKCYEGIKKEERLQCLRDADFDALMEAVNKSPGVFSYQGLALAWLPRVDGVFLTENPMKLVENKNVADIPFVSGNCDDEGTMFSFASSIIKEDEQFEEWLRTYWLPNAPATTVSEVMDIYPDDLAKGSPFGTGNQNQYGGGQFKRLAAFQGDAVFHAPRRHLIQSLSERQNVWTFLSTRFKYIPNCGAFHASDLLNMMSGGDMTDYLVRFITNFNPNAEGEEEHWPQYYYKDGDKKALEFFPILSTKITTDDYRIEEMENLTQILLEHPL